MTPHARSAAEVLQALQSSEQGLSRSEAEARLQHYGPNAMPQAEPPGIFSVFAHQFASPLIYVLVLAALVSLVIREWSDAGFIAGVLLVNAIIGTTQEFSAQRAAGALRQLVTTRCRVIRDDDSYEIDAEQLVPGDLVQLESGDRIPSDIRLLTSHDLEVDESLLTGESLAVLKKAQQILAEDSILGDRVNMVFAGTLVNRGRALGIVIDTGLHTELGKIASAVLGKQTSKPPLLVRMEKFTHRIALFVGLAAVLMALIAFLQGMALSEIFMLAVALAVSAIPEGLPVALTVALAIGMNRMAKRNVIVRQLVAVEALGSCTFIATDKTGTLTVNQLTARKIVLPLGDTLDVGGDSDTPDGNITATDGQPLDTQQQHMVADISLAAALCNEGFIGHRDGSWTHHGDAVDVALLIMAHKAGIKYTDCMTDYPQQASIPFESEHQFAASLNRVNDHHSVFVKGALEKLLTMCDRMSTRQGEQTIDRDGLQQQAHALASEGYRVMALASGETRLADDDLLGPQHLQQLTLLGMVAMIDPLRPEATTAIAACHDAGIQVAMVTGDHPTTAFALGRELGLVEYMEQVVTGPQIKQMDDPQQRDQRIVEGRVFARVEPQQKLGIVQSLQRSGHFVAVSGDGANDAPALRAAQVGVAMGRQGTDVARESAELIITDDNFSSIVAGVEEGRIAYANVRKVIFLLVSTGAAELVLFTLSLLFGLPIPLLAVQLLWLNLVTNGIQDIALAFEPGEGNELKQAPRPPEESIFNPIMLERIIISALVIGGLAFLVFSYLLELGMTVDQARNQTLLLMVLFENVHVFNSRSETLSALRHNPLRNRLLLFGTLVAQAIHIGAMYTPGLNGVLNIEPVNLTQWLELLTVAFSVFVVMELHKLYRCWRPHRTNR